MTIQTRFIGLLPRIVEQMPDDIWRLHWNALVGDIFGVGDETWTVTEMICHYLTYVDVKVMKSKHHIVDYAAVLSLPPGYLAWLKANRPSRSEEGQAGSSSEISDTPSS